MGNISRKHSGQKTVRKLSNDTFCRDAEKRVAKAKREEAAMLAKKDGAGGSRKDVEGNYTRARDCFKIFI